MKKIILTFGLISGVLASLLMLAMLPFFRYFEHGNTGMILGYTAIVLVALLIYFGIRSYRDNVGGGTISFGRGFAIGLGISLISCIFYVFCWEIIYFNFMHGSLADYFNRAVAQAQASGASPEAIQAKVAEIRHSEQMYENPLINSLWTFIEPFPVDLAITILSAAILRRKKSVQPAGLSAVA